MERGERVCLCTTRRCSPNTARNRIPGDVLLIGPTATMVRNSARARAVWQRDSAFGGRGTTHSRKLALLAGVREFAREHTYRTVGVAG